MILVLANMTGLLLFSAFAEDQPTGHAEYSEQADPAVYELPPGRGPARVPKLLAVDGAEVRLSLRRGTETFEKKIRLRRLV